MHSTPMTAGEIRLDAAFRFGHFLGLTGAQVFAALREVDQITVMARDVFVEEFDERTLTWSMTLHLGQPLEQP